MSTYNKKYEITDIVHEKYFFLHRIRALRDIGPTVKAGDLGGFVEHERNLSFEPGDDAWIFGDAIAANAACVESGSILQDRATVCGSAVVQDRSVLSGYARVEDHASVVDALVGDRARVAGGGIVIGYSGCKRPTLAGSCVILGNVAGNVRVTGSAVVLGDEKIRNDSLFTVVVSEKGRTVERDPALDELRPLQPAEEKKKPRRKEMVR